MNLAIGTFVIMYLLFPLLAIAFAVMCYFVAKKNDLLSNKKLILSFLLFCLVLALPGFLGFIHYWFMPYVYVSLQVLYFFLGWWFSTIVRNAIEKKDDKKNRSKKAEDEKPESKPYYVEFLLVFITMFIGAALFSLIFNLCNEFQYGLWACTCLLPFIFPSVFRRAHQSFLDIPLEVYKLWFYKDEKAERWTNEMMDSSKVIVVEMELSKQQSDPAPLNIKAKAQENMPFGIWFKVFIDNYNVKSSSAQIAPYATGEDVYGWIFYTLTPIGVKRHIDPDLTFTENKVKEHRVVIAKRARFNQSGQIHSIDK
jgi:hypothetical protein